MRYGLVVVLTVMALGAPAQADIINVPGDQPTIQAAVNAAVPNDTIQIAGGTYNERILINNDLSGVTISGAADAFGGTVGGPGITTIDGGIEFLYASTITGLTFKNLYIRRDLTTYLAGAIIRAGSTTGDIDDFTLQDCCLDGELQTGIGGFYAVKGQFNGTVTVDHVEFKELLQYYVFETSSDGIQVPTITLYSFADNWIHDCNGTVSLRGEPTDWSDNVVVTGNIFDNLGGNASQTGDQWAAIEINRATNVTIKNNSVTNVHEGNFGEGQGVQLWDIETLEMSCNTVADNFQGIFVYTSTITDLVFRRNNITGNDEYGMKNDTGTEVDARWNWWGAADGPGPVGPGSGDDVSADIDFSPWLTMPVVEVAVTVELEDIVNTPIVRDITFVSANTSGAVLELLEPLTFTNKLATTTLCLPASCLSAKDRQHSLYSTKTISDLGGGNYAVNFTGIDKLLGGDLNNDNLDDIWDYGVTAAQLGTAGHPYPWPALDADFTDSGIVDKNDFLVFYRHYLTKGDTPCHNAPIPSVSPKTSITIYQLAPLVGGLTNAKKADLDKNYIINSTDVTLMYYKLFPRR